MVNADGMDSLIAAIVLVAVEDYRSGYNRADRPCPVAFLEAAGLLVDGQLDPRFGTVPKTRSGRPSHYGLGESKKIEALRAVIQKQYKSWSESRAKVGQK